MKFFSLVSAMLFGLAAAAPTVTVDSELAKRQDGNNCVTCAVDGSTRCVPIGLDLCTSCVDGTVSFPMLNLESMRWSHCTYSVADEPITGRDRLRY
ncbi:hypothetical protein HBI81_007920 [Parastagonospora nodorum]|nr:hypothetical protein HBH53_172500 [Parastagonospora nodorum]KAH5047436.1 hypothetical protein HBH96_227280 [Parastagonospora nodorum]KAH5121068.1 hypothetical protein HBH71_052380 [Parastagonospora nodorum]KAH5488593.1 hypothetical protein HBI52_232640 [Parastagonospora nodorum]KAH5546182.1 hypothetical protein HBI27_047620 [Parastagonospora nodorum]